MPIKTKIRPPFKTNGGKYYLSTWIINHFPEDYKELTYVEPYLGAGSILLNKEASKEEAVNDLDVGNVEIFKALRDEPGTFIGRLKRTKYRESTFDKAVHKQNQEFDTYMDLAINEFILKRMSCGGNKKYFSSSEQEETSWDTIVHCELELIAERIKNIFIFTKPTKDVIKAFDTMTAFCFCNPPEISNGHDEQIELVDILIQCKCKVMLIGHSCALYRNKFKDWRCARKNQHGGRKAEFLWMNYGIDEQ